VWWSRDCSTFVFVLLLYGVLLGLGLSVCLFIRRFASKLVFFAASLALLHLGFCGMKGIHRIFKNIDTPINQLLDKVKLFFYW
jgi:hypothetical protein